MRPKVKRTFKVVIEQDEDGVFVASVPELPGCHTEGKTLKALHKNIREVIEGYLEAFGYPKESLSRFVKVQKVEVAV